MGRYTALLISAVLTHSAGRSAAGRHGASELSDRGITKVFLLGVLAKSWHSVYKVRVVGNNHLMFEEAHT